MLGRVKLNPLVRLNQFISRPAREELDFEPTTITDRVHKALGIEHSCQMDERTQKTRDRVISRMKEHTDDFFSAINSGSYKLDKNFIELSEKVKKAGSLKEILSSVLRATQGYYDLIFPQSDVIEKFFLGDTDSNGGFLNSMRLQASLFGISVNKLFGKLPNIKDFSMEQVERVLNRIQESNSKFVESLASMHIGVLKKLYNLLGEKFKKITLDPYNFNPKHFDFDSSTLPKRLLPKKYLAEDLVEAIKRKPFYIQMNKKKEIDLSRPALGCPAFFIRDKSGKALPNVVADWFQEIIRDYVYPQFPRLFNIATSPLV